MDKVEEATFNLGKRHDDFVSAAAVLPKMKAKRSVKTEAIHELNRVRVVRAAAGGKDRHSKVCTARGTRDRRVRLSPKTAILFYDVQDRLGYDRPSKAIDWLMKASKATIDALNFPPTAAATDQNQTNSKNQQFLKFECGNDDDNPIAGFDFFNEVAAPPLSSAEFQAPISIIEGGEGYREQFLSAPTTPLELFDANSEIIRLQRFFSWNYAGEDHSSVSSAPLHYPPAAAAADYHVFSEREPLQSSYSGINSSNSPQFQGGFSFSEQELPSFCAAATFKEDDEMSYVPVHYQE